MPIKHDEPDLDIAPLGLDNWMSSGWMVVVYDNDTNSIDEVIAILMLATKCTYEEAVMETMEVHHLGKGVVHHGGKPECEEAASIIRSIGIRVEVLEDK